MGASNHTSEERESADYYATAPKAVERLLRLEKFNRRIWECACGAGHMSMVLERHGYEVRSTDLFYRGYGEGGIDFLSIENRFWDGDIITNPPYRYAQEFVEKAIEIVPSGNKVAMFLRILFLESRRRKALFLSHPPRTVYVSSSRLFCAKNGDFEKFVPNGSPTAYAWFVWEKGFSGIDIMYLCFFKIRARKHGKVREMGLH